jgi:hypothetical protein
MLILNEAKRQYQGMVIRDGTKMPQLICCGDRELSIRLLVTPETGDEDCAALLAI